MRIEIPSLAEIVSFCDPASGRPSSTGRARARTAVVTVGLSKHGEAFVLDALAGQWPTDEITNTIFKTQGTWNANRFGIEASAQQTLYVDSVIREAGTRRIRGAFIGVSQPTDQTKQFRITTVVQKWMHNGLLYVNRDLSILLKELEQYPNGQTCDIVDALASCLLMLPDPFASSGKIVYELNRSFVSNKNQLRSER